MLIRSEICFFVQGRSAPKNLGLPFADEAPAAPLAEVPPSGWRTTATFLTNGLTQGLFRTLGAAVLRIKLRQPRLRLYHHRAGVQPQTEMKQRSSAPLAQPLSFKNSYCAQLPAQNNLVGPQTGFTTLGATGLRSGSPVYDCATIGLVHGRNLPEKRCLASPNSSSYPRHDAAHERRAKLDRFKIPRAQSFWGRRFAVRQPRFTAVPPSGWRTVANLLVLPYYLAKPSAVTLIHVTAVRVNKPNWFSSNPNFHPLPAPGYGPLLHRGRQILLHLLLPVVATFVSAVLLLTGVSPEVPAGASFGWALL